MKGFLPPRLLLPLAAVLALIGHHAFHAEEDPGEAFAYDRTESVILITLSGPQGTVLATPTSTLPVDILVERHSWEIWRQPSSGVEDSRLPITEPASGVEVTLSSDLGTPGSAVVTTDTQGRTSTSFTGGVVPGTPTLRATIGNTTASLSFDLPGESWIFEDSQGTLRAALEAPGGTTDVPSGESRELILSVVY